MEGGVFVSEGVPQGLYTQTCPAPLAPGPDGPEVYGTV